MKLLPTMLLMAMCLATAGCASREPVPFPSSEEIAAAYYGEYPQNYERIISTNAEFNNYWHPAFEFNDVPRKTMVEWLGKYEYGWGGFVDTWLEDRKRVNMDKIAYQYLIRDGKIVMLERVNRGFR